MLRVLKENYRDLVGVKIMHIGDSKVLRKYGKFLQNINDSKARNSIEGKYFS